MDMSDNFIEKLQNERYIEDFKKTVRGPFSKHLNSNEVKIVNANIGVYNDAIYQGYLDACRTFSYDKAKITTFNDFLKNTDLATIMKDYMDGNENFKFNHDSFCERLLKFGDMKYGQAQKIVNMAFKYLCCLSDAEDFEKKFKKCHMPLDGIMLEWLVREDSKSNSDKKIVKKNMSSWSMITKGTNNATIDDNGKYTYKFYVEKINELGEGKPPLQLDFENWRTMQLRLSAESLLKTFYLENVDEKKCINQYSKELKKKELDDLLKDVKRVVDDYQKK